MVNLRAKEPPEVPQTEAHATTTAGAETTFSGLVHDFRSNILTEDESSCVFPFIEGLLYIANLKNVEKMTEDFVANIANSAYI